MQHVLLLALVLLAGRAVDAQTAAFQGLGDLPGGGVFSRAHDVSADGAVVVGRSESAVVFGAASYEAFRWTAEEGMVGLGRLPGGTLNQASEAFAASADGAVIVGVSPATNGYMAFRWTADGGMVGLGRLPNAFESGARGVSADGAVVVGSSGNRAFKWTAADGLIPYGSSSSSSRSSGHGVSADATLLVGSACLTVSRTCSAIGWTPDGFVNFGHLAGPEERSSEAFAVTDDGGVVIGRSGRSRSQEVEAFRWTSSSGMVGLGLLPGHYSSEAHGVSADGATVVGWSSSSAESGAEAVRWTADGGMQRVVTLLAAAGVDVSGWTLTEAWGVSDDGMVIVGTGLNPQGQSEAWRAVLPVSVGTPQAPETEPVISLTVSPNPVGRLVTLRFRLRTDAPVRLSLHDVLGREVAVAVDGWRAAGPHEAALDVSALPAGVYVARLAAGTPTATQRLTVVR